MLNPHILKAALMILVQKHGVSTTFLDESKYDLFQVVAALNEDLNSLGESGMKHFRAHLDAVIQGRPSEALVDMAELHLLSAATEVIASISNLHQLGNFVANMTGEKTEGSYLGEKGALDMVHKSMREEGIDFSALVQIEANGRSIYMRRLPAVVSTDNIKEGRYAVETTKVAASQ